MWQLLARLIPLRWVIWLGERRISIEEFVFSMKAYLALYKAGFRISRSSSFGKVESHIHRFYWKGDVIERLPDIDNVGNNWNTIANGRVMPLKKPFVAMSENDYQIWYASQERQFNARI